MYLKEIKLGNIRPFSYKKIKLQKGINVVFGENGAGKTTILEAIHLLSLGKSFKTTHAEEYIKKNQERYKITGKTNTETNIQIEGTKTKKTIKFQEKIIKKTSDHIKNFPVIISTPDEMVYEGDQNKRRQRNLNKNMCLGDSSYMEDLKKYNTIIKQRNLAIKQNQEFSIWNKQIIKTAEKIWKKRKAYIKNVNKELKKIKETKNNIETSIEITGTETDTDTITKQYSFFYQKDKEKGHTSYGPHRDKILYFFENKKIKNYISQGEKALFFAALKKAEGEIIKKQTKKEPIVLLDDIFSKTDTKNKKKIISLFENNKQTIITHTEKVKEIKNNINVNG